jgi:hypothetical protein
VSLCGRVDCDRQAVFAVAGAKQFASCAAHLDGLVAFLLDLSAERVVCVEAVDRDAVGLLADAEWKATASERGSNGR